MNVDELAVKIREFLRREMGLEGREVAADTPLVTSGLIDSIGLVRLAALLETETGITIPDRDIQAENFDSLKKIQAYISSRVPR